MFHFTRFPRLLVSLACLPLLAGCFKTDTVLKVNPDGTGRLVQSIEMSEQSLQQMQAAVAGFAQAMGAQAKPQTDMFSTDSFRVKAGDYGPGVKLLGVKKTKKNGRFRAVAQYSVADVSKLKLSEDNKPPTPGPGAPQPKKSKKSMKFSVRKLAGGLSELTIKMPPPEPTPKKKPRTRPQPTSQQANQPIPPQMLEMLKDLEMTVAIECGKKIVKTNATNVKGNRITLVHVAFGKLMEHQDKLRELQQLGPKAQDLEAVKPLLKDIEGVQFEFEPVVKVKFR